MVIHPSSIAVWNNEEVISDRLFPRFIYKGDEAYLENGSSKLELWYINRTKRLPLDNNLKSNMKLTDEHQKNHSMVINPLNIFGLKCQENSNFGHGSPNRRSWQNYVTSAPPNTWRAWRDIWSHYWFEPMRPSLSTWDASPNAQDDAFNNNASLFDKEVLGLEVELCCSFVGLQVSSLEDKGVRFHKFQEKTIWF